MNYQDKETELDEQIRTELRRLAKASKNTSGASPNPAELRSIFQNSSVRKIVRSLPLSSYIRKVRTYAEANVEDFAATMNVPPDVIRKLETNESEPWTLPAQAIAEVARGLRLHLTALETLTRNSHTVATLSKTLSDPDSATQLMAIWLEEVSTELRQHGPNELLDD